MAAIDGGPVRGLVPSAAQWRAAGIAFSIRNGDLLSQAIYAVECGGAVKIVRLCAMPCIFRQPRLLASFNFDDRSIYQKEDRCRRETHVARTG